MQKRQFLSIRASRQLLRLTLLSFVLISGCGRPAAVDPVADATGGSSAETVASDSTAESSRHAGWVGSQACRDCHSAIFERYTGHPMWQTLAGTAQATAIEDFADTKFSGPGGLEYRVERDSGTQAATAGTAVASVHWHHELRRASDGSVLYDQRVPFELAVGSGAHGRSWLRNLEGRLYQSPVTWYSEDAHWGLSPGYNPEFHDRFERRVTHACLSCHAGRSLPVAGEPDRFQEPLFAEQSIGCERCHGPGEQHVQRHRNSTVADAVADPIINPAHFRDSRLDAVCNQCHLAGQRRVLRNGHTEFDFRPGMQVSDLWTVFVKTKGTSAAADETAGAVSHVEQMHASRCWQQSAGALSCISCHDPHAVPGAEQEVEWYRKKCLECHSGGRVECSEQPERRANAGRNDSCIVCHMPASQAADVHSAQTDHRVLRRPRVAGPAETAVAEKSPPQRDERSLIPYVEPGVPEDSQELVRARGIYLSELAYFGGSHEAAERSLTLLDQSLARDAADIDALLARGRALIQLGRLPDAVKSLEALLKLSPRHETALEVLASAQHESGRIRSARSTYERLIDVNPHRSRYYGRYAHVLGQLQEYSRGVAAAERALELDPSLVQAHQWLQMTYEYRGIEKLADYHRRMAEQLTGGRNPAERRVER